MVEAIDFKATPAEGEVPRELAPHLAGLPEKLEALSGQNLFACNQCGMCSSGCPFTDHMDLLPNQIIRRLQLRDARVMGAGAMWICASCLACQVRCPKGVDLSKLMEAMRQVYLREQMDQVAINELTAERVAAMPQIALVASFRKKTG
jgi:heterodisulfide reductase subunit C